MFAWLRCDCFLRNTKKLFLHAYLIAKIGAKSEIYHASKLLQNQTFYFTFKWIHNGATLELRKYLVLFYFEPSSQILNVSFGLNI